MKFTLTTKEAIAAFRCSESTLLRLRKAGVLRPGVHFLAASAGTIAPTLLWNPEAVQETLARRSRQILSA